MGYQYHDSLKSDDFEMLVALRPASRDVVTVDHSQSQDILIGGELHDFELLNSKEQALVIKKTIFEFKKLPDIDKIHFSLALITGDGIYIAGSKNACFFLCLMKANGVVEVEPLRGEHWQLDTDLFLFQPVIQEKTNAYLVQVPANCNKPFKQLQNEIAFLFNTSYQCGDRKYLPFDKRVKLKSTFPMSITNLNTKDNTAKWMANFSGCEHKKERGVANFYNDLLTRMTSFMFECREIIHRLQLFFRETWNLALLQTDKPDERSFFQLFSSPVTIRNDVFYLTSTAVRLVKYVFQQQRLKSEERDSCILMLKKIHNIVIPMIKKVLDSLNKTTLMISDLPQLKDPQHLFYASLYLTLEEVEQGKLNLKKYECIFGNAEMRELFKLEDEKNYTFASSVGSRAS